MPDVSILPASDRERLAKLCGLLASDFDGERANAARKATDLLRRHGLTWRDLVTPTASQQPPAGPIYGDGNQSAFAFRHLEVLTAWEQDFIRSVLGRQNLSAKQRHHLSEIVAKVRLATAA